MPTYPLAKVARSLENAGVFLRVKKRKKDGKVHRYWSIVENRRVSKKRVVQKQVLYLGELNDQQRAGWIKTIEAVEGNKNKPRQLALFPSDLEKLPKLKSCEVVRIQLDGIQLKRPRQWGGCWLACTLWDLLDLDSFWSTRVSESRKGTQWLNVLKTLVAYRLIDPGSEFRLHREWFDRSAMADLLGETFRIAAKNTLYRCLDRLTPHKEELFQALQSKWSSLFEVRHDVLLYDLTSTYFECDPPENGKRRYGHSRDHRPDCVQVVIALVVTPEGFPLTYEIYPGNTQDQSTLTEFLERIEKQYGKARRVWLMDRGIPTERTLEQMRNQGGKYLVGTPKGRLSKLEEALLSQPWHHAREHVRVKLLEESGEFYVYVESADRVAKERSMRRRRLKRLWKRLQELQQMKKQSRDDLLMRLGAARKAAGRAWSLVKVRVPEEEETVTPETFRFEINRGKLRERRRREGRYLLRSNMTRESPEHVWEKYIQLTQIEQAFKDLKGDLSIRPVYHQTDERIEAHIFVSFLSYCLFATLRHLLRPHATGLTPRSAIEKVSQMQMVDIHLPTTDGRTIVLSRYTEPEQDLKLLLEKLKLCLPAQPPPRVYSNGEVAV